MVKLGIIYVLESESSFLLRVHGLLVQDEAHVEDAEADHQDRASLIPSALSCSLDVVVCLRVAKHEEVHDAWQREGGQREAKRSHKFKHGSNVVDENRSQDAADVQTERQSVILPRGHFQIRQLRFVLALCCGWFRCCLSLSTLVNCIVGIGG